MPLLTCDPGFKNLVSSQLLSDQIFYSDTLDAQQWLVYYILKPLTGSYEQVKITPATLPNALRGLEQRGSTGSNVKSEEIRASNSSSRKAVNSFNDLLNGFPMIARQMQPGLEKVLDDLKQKLQKLPPALPSKSSGHSRRSSGASSQSNGSIHSNYSNGHPKSPAPATNPIDSNGDHLRRTVEAAVTATIDLFQHVDKQQLSFLGTTTDLTGSTVERMIEHYITEQLHDVLLFPRVRTTKQIEDLELERRIHSMQHIDIAQVGIAIEGGRAGKARLMERIAKGVEEFRKLTSAGSPQRMLAILLNTQKFIASEPDSNVLYDIKQRAEPSEKPSATITINADTLVSLLLMVVIRAQVRHLQARLTYMRDFIFVEDVESGEAGYALSTFEAVLTYLATDSGGLRQASRRNKRLWKATREGAIQELKAILDPGATDFPQPAPKESDEEAIVESPHTETQDPPSGKENVEFASRRTSSTLNEDRHMSESSTLAHVFPFQTPPTPRKGKRVSMDVRSLSNTSDHSFISRTTTLDSNSSAIEGDMSVETLAQSQDEEGDSILMMAVEARQPQALDYLLSLEEYFPIKLVLEDTNKDGTNLLSAAVQLGHPEAVEILLRRVLQIRDREDLISFIGKPDNRGRAVAHYLFHTPYLITRIANLIPWKMKDKHGQTPLLALCRSYDHPDYSEMVNESLQFATQQQGDGQPLHLDDHVDAKGNSLLHAINDPALAARILRYCDSDANATNDRQFTPLMVASKYGRMDMVRVFFGDKRVDYLARESRGMTAVELAKDDEIRNRIDDMVLVSNVPAADGRVTAVVRSFLVEDGSIRLIIKSAIRNEETGMIGITTCRRSLNDFENLAKWLAMEHPASWLPSIFDFRSPFYISSRPSRAVLQDIQFRLDKFLKIMLAHSTFSTHELLWEFILFPEIQPEMMAERSKKKAEIRSENLLEEYEPIEDIREVSTFVDHAQDSIRGISLSTKSVMRRVNNIRLGVSSEPLQIL